jgi:hypothetical protein
VPIASAASRSNMEMHAWQSLLGWIARCRLEAVKKVGKMIREYLWGVLNAIVANIPGSACCTRQRPCAQRDRGQRFQRDAGGKERPHPVGQWKRKAGVANALGAVLGQITATCEIEIKPFRRGARVSGYLRMKVVAVALHYLLGLNAPRELGSFRPALLTNR